MRSLVRNVPSTVPRRGTLSSNHANGQSSSSRHLWFTPYDQAARTSGPLAWSYAQIASSKHDASSTQNIIIDTGFCGWPKKISLFFLVVLANQCNFAEPIERFERWTRWATTLLLIGEPTLNVCSGLWSNTFNVLPGDAFCRSLMRSRLVAGIDALDNCCLVDQIDDHTLLYCCQFYPIASYLTWNYPSRGNKSQKKIKFC